MSVSFSVVTPTYNRSALIGETLRSIQAQTYQPTEIVIVDDGSTDDTAETVAAFADPRIRYIKIRNSGELVARNTGIRLATGDFIAFCDSDDLWRPTFLERCAELLALRPDLRSIYANFSVFRDQTWESRSKFDDAPPGYWDGVQRIGHWAAVIDGSWVERLVGFQPFFNSSMVVAREDFLASGGWDESVTGIVGCDFATTLRVGERGKIGVLFESLAGVRRHGQNFSGNVERMNLGDARVLEYVLETRPSLQPHAAQIRAGIARRRRDAMWHAFHRRDFATVRQIAKLVPPASWTERLKIAIAYAFAPLERTSERAGPAPSGRGPG